MIREVLADPPRLHAMFAHFPVAVSLLGVVLLLFLLVDRGRHHALRWACVTIYVLGAVTAFAATWSGESAAELASASPRMTDEAFDLMLTHESMGAAVGYILLIPAVAVGLSVLPGRRVRMLTLSIAMLAALAALVWVSAVGHYGGLMVYSHGLGPPA